MKIETNRNLDESMYVYIPYMFEGRLANWVIDQKREKGLREARRGEARRGEERITHYILILRVLSSHRIASQQIPFLSMCSNRIPLWKNTLINVSMHTCIEHLSILQRDYF